MFKFTTFVRNLVIGVIISQSVGSSVYAEWKRVKKVDSFGDETEDEMVWGVFPATIQSGSGPRSGHVHLTYRMGGWNLSIRLDDQSSLFLDRITLNWKDSEKKYQAIIMSGKMLDEKPSEQTYPGGKYNFTLFLLERDSIKCSISSYDGELGSYNLIFTVQCSGYKELAEDLHSEAQKQVIASHDERKKGWESERVSKIRYQDVLHEREQAKLKRSEPMLFQTMDMAFSVNALCLGFNDEEVRLKRVDNGVELKVKRAILSEETNRLIQLRFMDYPPGGTGSIALMRGAS